MTDAGLELQGFQFDVGTQTRKQVVALGGRGSGRRLLQTGSLLQRFVINLDAPSALIEFRRLVKVECHIA